MAGCSDNGGDNSSGIRAECGLPSPDPGSDISLVAPELLLDGQAQLLQASKERGGYLASIGISMSVTDGLKLYRKALKQLEFELVSEDTDKQENLSFDQLRADTSLPLLAKLAHRFGAHGIRLTTRGESPAGAGIAGSSAMNVAICGALAKYTGASHDPEALLDIAKDVEAQVIKVPTGLQDYRPAMYGGVAAVEPQAGQTRRVALDVDPREAVVLRGIDRRMPHRIPFASEDLRRDVPHEVGDRAEEAEGDDDFSWIVHDASGEGEGVLALRS
jgi:hypothetical protein